MHWMLDPGCWILDTGYSILDAGCLLLDNGKNFTIDFIFGIKTKKEKCAA